MEGATQQQPRATQQQSRATQQQTVTIGRGLFLARYAAAEDTARPPMIRLSPQLAAANNIGFFLHPDQSEPVMWQPGTCLVVRASAPGKLSVEVTPVEKDGSVAATVKIEPLTQGVPPSALMPGNGKLNGLRDDF